MYTDLYLNSRVCSSEQAGTPISAPGRARQTSGGVQCPAAVSFVNNGPKGLKIPWPSWPYEFKSRPGQYYLGSYSRVTGCVVVAPFFIGGSMPSWGRWAFFCFWGYLIKEQA